MRIILVLTFLITISTLPAQNAKLKGEVYLDETKTPLDSVTVTIVGTDSLLTFVSTSNSEGYYEFANLPQETYRIEFYRKGFELREIAGVLVQTNKITFVDARLERLRTRKRKKRKKRRK